VWAADVWGYVAWYNACMLWEERLKYRSPVERLYGDQRLCRLVAGQKSNDPLSPDYIPTIFGHTKSPRKRKMAGVYRQYKRRKGTCF